MAEPQLRRSRPAADIREPPDFIEYSDTEKLKFRVRNHKCVYTGAAMPQFRGSVRCPFGIKAN
jgi:hypothetical protein